ncbi:TPA: hypothetical protein PXM39_003627 [Yersinia enterocolitica]|nr:hypothetical protein [Yersinia enterocolitica]HDL6901020.1 hypothetical protein [Yersinia enterocolitica]HDL7092126.1 hypothetical protein [Yersinia enterocolitica]HDL7101164.1 hypothetical protein [Yersinia enterocolitica]HDL7135645.1 hypothetical protein [Yersinia enterocolitica]
MTVLPEIVQRDEQGCWTNSNFYTGTDALFNHWLEKQNLEHCISFMDCGDDSTCQALMAKYNSGSADFSGWLPEAPEGGGWFVGSIHDSEEGPVCIWLRFITQTQPTATHKPSALALLTLLNQVKEQDDEDIDSGVIELRGLEDENGNDCGATLSVTKLANDAHTVINDLMQQLACYQKRETAITNYVLSKFENSNPQFVDEFWNNLPPKTLE